MKIRLHRGILLFVLIIMLFELAAAETNQKLSEYSDERWVVPKVSEVGVISEREAYFYSFGCKTIHELRDAWAIRCPKGVHPPNAFPDKILYLSDIESVNQINADDVWALGFNGSGMTVAVIDTGIDTDHPELMDSIIGGKSFIEGIGTFEDDNGHGTRMAGIITANGINTNAIGVAPNANVWIAKAFNSSGAAFGSDVISAIEYIVNNNISKIMSMSFGANLLSIKENCDDDDPVSMTANWAVSNGVTSVAAAGNSINGSDGVYTPACASGAIAVGAVNKNDIRAGFSNIGLALDLMAPGEMIFTPSIGGGYGESTGTSPATPHVAAAVALLKQAFPSATDSMIKDALYKTAKDLGEPGFDMFHGWGRVDALAAFNFLKSLRDVAVTGIDAPAIATKGDIAAIKVNVANNGTTDEELILSLTDATDDVEIDSKIVNLPSASSQVLTFNWDTNSASIGSHSIKAEADIQDTNNNNNAKTAIVEVKERLPLTIGASSLANGEVGIDYNDSLEVSGGFPPYSIEIIKGKLPLGLSINAGGIITGMPTNSKNSGFKVKVTDQKGASATKEFAIKIHPELKITTKNLKSGKVGKKYSRTLKATGGLKPYEWLIVSGKLPNGLFFDNSKGSITGVPIEAGNFDITFKVRDQLGGASQKSFRLAIS